MRTFLACLYCALATAGLAARAPAGKAFSALLDEAIAAGSIRPLDTARAAVVLYGMVNSALLQCFVNEGGEGQEQYIDLLVDAVERWLINPDSLPDHR